MKFDNAVSIGSAIGGSISGSSAIGGKVSKLGGGIGIPTTSLQSDLSSASIRPKILMNEEKYARILKNLCAHERHYFLNCLQPAERKRLQNVRHALQKPVGIQRSSQPPAASFMHEAEEPEVEDSDFDWNWNHVSGAALLALGFLFMLFLWLV